VPEQEFPPLRRSSRSYRPDRDEEEPPPWANLPPVRPPRSRPGGDPAAVPGGRHVAPGGPDGTDGPDQRPSGPTGHFSSASHAGPVGPAGPGGPGARLAESRPGSRPDRREPDRRGEVPSWAEWDGPEADGDADLPQPSSREPRAPGGRALRAAARRRRRWFVLGGSLVVVVGAVLAVVLLTSGGPGPASVTPNALITTFQPGELRQVPNACHVVPAATVQQYLPGTLKVASPLQVNGPLGSACNWTVDKPPLYRLMQLNLNAFAPNGLASGNGSATRAAMDAYALARQDMQHPPKGAPARKTTVRLLSGFGNEAFSALQVFHVTGAVTDVATVTVRYHNVVVTVTLNALEHSDRGNYGPVSQSQLTAAAMAFAKAAESSLH
jgi:hypothetical protein